MSAKYRCSRCGSFGSSEYVTGEGIKCFVCGWIAPSSTLSATLPPQKSEAVLLAQNPTGGVYLINSGAYYKIGKANDFGQRLRQINLELPEKAVEIHRIYTDDPLGIESYWHKRFKARRMNGEWFALTEEDVEIFKARTRM